mmetsp:Transcript_46660/g.74616  ORF Transcript_46660/g.74616 Transcript_46660/m.74616 type:complete len:223 (+) Transcript_46660:1767-2435(+)
MRRSEWLMPALRSDTKARSFHFDAHTATSAAHALPHRSSLSGGSIPASSIASSISSSISGGGSSDRTHILQALSVRVSDASDESSTVAVNCASSAATDLFIGSLRMCSMVPKGITMERGSRIQSGIFPPPRLSFSARVLRALAPTTPAWNSSSGTENFPQKGICSSLIPEGTKPRPLAPVPACVAPWMVDASTASHATSSPFTVTLIGAPSASASVLRMSGS